MKVKGKNDHTSIVCILFMLSSSVLHAGAMGAESVTPLGTIYVGAFGGVGDVASVHLVQQGTALYPYGNAGGYINNKGPLAVNAFGKSNHSSAWLAGGHVGYRWPERTLKHFSDHWTVAPASELEGYYLGKATLRGSDLNNSTALLFEHNFHVTYPMQTGVFLVNAVLNAHSADLGRLHPYIGIGTGAAVVSISGAKSLQTAPLEPGVNHYNSDASDTTIAFAAQPKAGISFYLNQDTNVFLEYRFLYLSTTDFTFGPTSYPTHVATTNWKVKLHSQYYNMGTVGIQFDL